MTAKLKLKCLATDRPDATDEKLLVFITYANDSRPHYAGIKSAASDYIQEPANTDVDRLYAKIVDVSDFLIAHYLLDIPQPTNPEVEAYSRAHTAWIDSDLSSSITGRGYTDARKLFISHEVLKAGYTFSEALYNKFT
jgi:hypothetical protein